MELVVNIRSPLRANKIAIFVVFSNVFLEFMSMVADSRGYDAFSMRLIFAP
jgi:hypothetical protein